MIMFDRKLAVVLIAACAIGCQQQDTLTETDDVADAPEAQGDEKAREDAAETDIRAEITKIARIEEPSLADTNQARNLKLNAAFREYALQLGRPVTGETVKRFNALVSEAGMTTFDDFLAAVTTPVRSVKDPASGETVPVYGPLGSDLINTWLTDLDVAVGKPLEEQPIYVLATEALCEHIDFALVGIKDPNLSLEMLPAKLRANAEWAYLRLNPTGKFGGGFDHPLFYATVREATKKLFGEDYPQAKITMADLVATEEAGGFGIESCLLCHDRNHTGVYKRLLGQSLHLHAKAADIRESGQDYVDDQGNQGRTGSATAKQTETLAADFALAAQRLLDAFPDKTDAEGARRSLAMLAVDNVARLKPGYDDFIHVLDEFGCMECHSSESEVPAKLDPAKHKGFVLRPNKYYKVDNITQLAKVIDLDDLGNSRLLRKARAKVKHRGAEDVRLDAAQADQLQRALAKWVFAAHTTQQSQQQQ